MSGSKGFEKTGEELSYLTTSGHQVFTSQYHRNRGTCCKSNCLHCPYGTTLKRLGLQFRSFGTSEESKEHAFLNHLIQQRKPSSIGLDILNQGFSKKQNAGAKFLERSNYPFIWIIILKGVDCGAALIKNNQVEDLILDKFFSDQGIDQDLVAFYYGEFTRSYP